MKHQNDSIIKKYLEAKGYLSTYKLRPNNKIKVEKKLSASEILDLGKVYAWARRN